MFVSMGEEEGERREGEEGGGVFCVCFKSFEGGGVDGGEGECFFSLFTK